MERQVRLRAVTRAAFTRASTALQTLLNVEDLDVEKIEVSLAVFEKRNHELCEINARIVDLLLEDENSDLEAEYAGVERYEIQFMELQHKASSLLRGDAKSQLCGDNNVYVQDRKFKLPKLEFRKFGGDIREWLPFWGQFQKIDSDSCIADDDKFQYLRQATIEGSRARDIVESFPPTGKNYKKALDGLKARFGREDLLVEVYVRELLKLILSVHQDRKRFSLAALYDKLETYLRALETLNVTSDKCASMLFPLVESCFAEDFLKVWHRSTTFSEKEDAQDHLTKLMTFLKIEVEGEERISLATEGFGLVKRDTFREQKKQRSYHVKEKNPTAAGLLSSTTAPDVKTICVFCQGKHPSLDCFAAQKMSLADKQMILKEKGVCFACLKPGHMIKACRVSLRCIICSKKHVPLMCPQLKQSVSPYPDPPMNQSTGSATEVNMASFNYGSKVFLQTLKAKLICEGKEREVRILLDSGSQKTYILKNVAGQMGYIPVSKETIVHALFGGSTQKVQHNCYSIRLKSLHGQFKCSFEALDQKTICCNVAPVENGPWIKELKSMRIHLSDIGETASQIHILIGADIMGKLLTGRRKVLPCGLVAVETYLGWTLMGRVSEVGPNETNMSMMITSLFMKEANITDLWSLDIIGISDPLVSKSRIEKEMQVERLFQESIKVNDEGRYEVSLPWTDESLPLPNNKTLALKRLETTTRKLSSENLLLSYDEVFKNWLSAGIIEEVSTATAEHEHYLPHRPVVKEQGTTKIRPVFDASAREKGSPSLNQCLEGGPNLIELIPSIMLKFRRFKYGVVSDIEKAFLQISVAKEDRDYLRFFWRDQENKQLKTFRHARVVFGVKCSPFLLGAVIKYHLQKCMCNSPFDRIIDKLLNSFYVDNVLTSLNSQEELKQFIQISQNAMAQGKFNLRGWQYTGDQDLDVQTVVLGQIWNRKEDTLSLKLDWVHNLELTTVTKRTMLSIAQKVYDPFGYTAAVMLCPKLMLQKTWKLGLNWDAEIPEPFRKEFLNWFDDLHVLEKIKFDRWFHIPDDDLKNCSIHTFCDASKDAYAAVVFLRLESDDEVNISLLSAKSRVAPLKGGTIPRLELLSALVGARLTRFVVKALNFSEVPCYYWSDSTAVLAWIKREENWSVFVRNRVSEIRKISSSSSWNHISGECNPADLPSRGCKASQLLAAKWWEGPMWLRNPIDEWPVNFFTNENNNEEEIEKEKMKSSILLVNNIKTVQDKKWYYAYFSKYQQIVRLIGWILRFRHNSSSKDELKFKGELSSTEFLQAERRVVRMIQKEAFVNGEDEKLKSLNVYLDEYGILRLKTKIIYRRDHEDFVKPMILPSQHGVVEKLIVYHHQKNSHAGVQILLNLLRERYWVLNGRKTVKKMLSKCVVCRRYTSKKLEAESCPLPENRIKDAAVFQVTGVDLTGPLYLRDNKKAWVALFTCAVYRAVHLELVTSISTESFLLALRRFISRRGRCRVIYCDNGTNFTGAGNLLASLNWNEVLKHGAVNAIEFKFNPPTASWWGGWWERLIRILKDLLKRVLGRALLTYEELMTVLCDSESVINSRPLTYLSDSDAELQPISPAMFLQDIDEWRVPDLDVADHKSLNKRLRYRQNIQKHLRNRFRSEYLGLLIQRAEKGRKFRQISIGDVVLVGADNSKRINWPLGRIIELIPGKDGNIRLVRVRTSTTVLLRPVQRIYPLEVASDAGQPSVPVKRETVP